VTVPRHYSLTLNLRRDALTFSGRVAIDIDGTGERIALDCAGLTIDSATPSVVEQTETTLILEGGTSHVEIAFRGAMSDHARGLYAGDGFCVTQMQPSNARRVFPCFDDPALKATFDVTVTSGDDVVITNGGTGAPMAAHMVLIAAGEFRISNFEFRISDSHRRAFDIRNAESDIPNSIPVRLFTLDDRDRYTYAIECARNALTFYENWLGAPYPWPRLDLIAVPTFEADGMESTGAIVFRGAAITGDNGRMATLIAHEIAHQWFGSLVTPASWAELWLSEGFATWLAAKATNADTALVREIRAAMAADSSHSARPLREETPDARELFDPIAYAKGAAILRMLEEHHGDTAVRDGVREVVRRHAGGSITTKDFWSALPVGAVLAAPFIEDSGVPQVSFDWSGDTARVSRRDPHARSVPVSMRITLADGSLITRRELIGDDVTSITMPAAVKSVFGNANAAGYYRSSYGRWSAVALDALSAAEKTTFLLDLYDATWAAETDTLVVLRVVESLDGDAATAEVRREIEEQLRDLLAPPTGAAADDGAANVLVELHGAERIAKCEELLRDARTRRTTWSFLKEHWEELQQELISFGGRGAIPALAATSEPDLRNDIAAFFVQHPPHGAERALQHTLQQIDARIRFREREQRKYICRTMWSEAGRPAATTQMRSAHSVLNGVAGALLGALLTRSLFDQIAIPALDWMRPSGELAATLGTLEQRFIRIFAGDAAVDEQLLRTAADARNELNAAGRMAENAQPAILAILTAREAASREHALGGVIAFVDLFDGEEPANRWRAALQQTDRAVGLARSNVLRVLRGDIDDALRASLARAALLLPGMLRAQAVDLAAAEAGVRGDRTFDHAAATWAAFGFSADEAAEWRKAGFAHPATARVAAARRR
jgi:hypothetical protein